MSRNGRFLAERFYFKCGRHLSTLTKSPASLFTRHHVFQNNCNVRISIRSAVLVIQAKRMPNLVQDVPLGARDRHIASIWSRITAGHICIFSSSGAH